jgi:hypothetical protein
MSLNKRQYLTTTGAVVSALAFAGCSGDDSSDSDGGSTDGSNGDDSNSGDSNTNGGDSSSDDQPNVELLNHEFYREQFSSGVRGTAVNNTDSELNYVEATAAFLDNDGTQIADGLDNVSGLAAGREWEFDCVFLGTDAERVARYEIEVSEGF